MMKIGKLTTWKTQCTILAGFKGKVDGNLTRTCFPGRIFWLDFSEEGSCGIGIFPQFHP